MRKFNTTRLINDCFKIRKTTRKKFKNVRKNIVLSKKLIKAFNTNNEFNNDINYINLFYVETYYENLMNAYDNLKGIIIDKKYLELLQSNKIIDLIEFKYLKVISENDTIYVDLNNPIDINSFDNK